MSIYKDMSEKMSRLLDERFSSAGLNITPIIQKFDNMQNFSNVTILKENEDVTKLNPLIVGYLKDSPIVPVESLHNTLPGRTAAVARIPIGYAGAVKMIDNPTLFTISMSHQINASLYELQKNLGDLSKFDLKFIEVDFGDYFRNVENSALYELRIVAKNKEA